MGMLLGSLGSRLRCEAEAPPSHVARMMTLSASCRFEDRGWKTSLRTGWYKGTLGLRGSIGAKDSLVRASSISIGGGLAIVQVHRQKL